MLIYNTSFHVDSERVLGSFLGFMRDEYLPAITAHGLIGHYRFVRLLTDIGEGMIGYAVMCDVADIQTLKRWKQEVGTQLESKLHARFGEKVLTFSTTMKDVELK